MRFLTTVGGVRPDGLFFAGDLGQRVFQTPFSWKSLGIDVRGRSQTLRVNYRTSHQIRSEADRLLPPWLADVDGLIESHRGTISVFNGPLPVIRIAEGEAAETGIVRGWIESRLHEGYLPSEIAVFVRSNEQIDWAKKAVAAARMEYVVLDETRAPTSGKLTISTMRLAKGLEFRGVVVMACDAGVLPLEKRIEGVSDEPDLEDVYSTERYLLYVACTRARDRLLVTGVSPGSEFLADLETQPSAATSMRLEG